MQWRSWKASKVITVYDRPPFSVAPLCCPVTTPLQLRAFFSEFHRNSRHLGNILISTLYANCRTTQTGHEPAWWGAGGHTSHNSSEIMRRVTASTLGYFTGVQHRRSSSFISLFLPLVYVAFSGSRLIAFQRGDWPGSGLRESRLMQFSK